jgi:hypothetical protein
MKKYLSIFFVLSTIIIFAACKKDSSSNNTTSNTPSYYFKFKVNGTEYSGTSVNGNQSAGDTTLDVACAFTYNGAISSLALFIAGGYSGPKTYSGISSEILMGGQTGNNYSSLPYNPPTIKITQDSNDEVKGEFSGTLYKDADSSSTKVSITDGSFYAKIIK